MIYLAVVLGVILISVVLAPFFAGSGGLLAAGASINSPEKLQAMKDAIVKRYLEDEAAFTSGSLGKHSWQKRREFLTHRYVDTSRRLDYLQTASREGGVA